MLFFINLGRRRGIDSLNRLKLSICPPSWRVKMSRGSSMWSVLIARRLRASLRPSRRATMWWVELGWRSMSRTQKKFLIQASLASSSLEWTITYTTKKILVGKKAWPYKLKKTWALSAKSLTLKQRSFSKLILTRVTRWLNLSGATIWVRNSLEVWRFWVTNSLQSLWMRAIFKTLKVSTWVHFSE